MEIGREFQCEIEKTVFGGDGLARAVRAGSYALSGAALLLCLFALATDSYNPFIYFRF